MNPSHISRQFREDGGLRDPLPERPDLDTPPGNRRSSRILRILLWILAAAILLHLLYTVLVHPVDRLTLGLLLGGGGSIRILVDRPFAHGEATVMVDGNLIAIRPRTGFEETQYYEIADGKLYTYERTLKGEWKRVDTGQAVTSILDEDESAFPIAFEALLQGKNYNRIPDGKFAYHLKDSVDKGDLKSVRFLRIDGKPAIEIVAPYGDFSTRYTFIFERVGMTRITPPWEE
ncbi:MAG: hypothetical protein IJX28_07730 [Clostridia bacterium]|nr:hypothetical protein [Clostridia bacterium]